MSAPHGDPLGGRGPTPAQAAPIKTTGQPAALPGEHERQATHTMPGTTEASAGHAPIPAPMPMHASQPTAVPAPSGSPRPTPPQGAPHAHTHARRPRPVRCYSLEALRDDPVHFPVPRRAAPVLESMPETSPIPSPDAPGETVGFPVPRPAPDASSNAMHPALGAPLTAAAAPSSTTSPLPPTQPALTSLVTASLAGSPAPASVPASPMHPSQTSQPVSPIAGTSQPMTPTRTRHRAHTVSVTMPSTARARFRPFDDIREAEGAGGRASVGSDFEHEGGSTISVRMSSDDGHGRSTPRRRRRANTEVMYENGELHDDAIGVLDCIDPEVSTLNHLQNVTNTLMFPNIPQLWNRRPTLVISASSDHSLESDIGGETGTEDILPAPVTAKHRGRSGTLTRMFGREPASTPLASQIDQSPPVSDAGSGSVGKTAVPKDHRGEFVPLQPIPAYSGKFADEDDGSSDDESETPEEHELDKHLRKVLVRQERKAKLQAALKGLWAYLKTPMGIITAFYGFNVVFWGAAIVLFLAGWIPTSSKDMQGKWVEISSQVVNGLFTVTGVGLIPWRAMDTYRMSVIWTLRKRFERRCKKRGLKPIEDPDDLPDPTTLEGYEDVLTEEEHAKLVDQQTKFAKSQTWYRPHATATHRAFPMSLALWNTILMDGNSFFQCLLCGCMWGMNRHTRPPWTTGSLIPLSFLCGIGAGVLIWQGGKRTKKTAAVEDKLRKALAVDEPVPQRVKKLRRSTVSGNPPAVINGDSGGAPLPKRSATSELPHLSTGEYRLDRDAILGSVTEADEPLSYEWHDARSSLDGSKEHGDAAAVHVPGLRRESR